MTLSFSWWHFIANSSSEMHLKSLLKLSKNWHGSLRYSLLWTAASQGIVCKTVLVASAQQDDSHKTLFPVPHFTLFCHTSLSELLCSLRFPIRVMLKVEIPHYWSYALLQASRVYFVCLSMSTASSLAPSVSQWPKLVPLHSSGTWR